MATKPVVFAIGLVLVLAAFPAPAQEPVITSQSEVSLVGCVEGERAYRTRIGMATGGISAQELVLTGVQPAAGAGSAPAGVTGDFGLTGKLEPQLLADVGRRVSIVGYIEDMATHSSPRHTPTMRRLFIKVWQPAGACSER
jgi:hypothetical protein